MDRQTPVKHNLRKLRLRAVKMNYLFCRIIYWYKDCGDKMKQKVEESIQQLTIELQTGGNVRYEHGSLSDIWYEEN